jgi:cold shock CspA family protein
VPNEALRFRPVARPGAGVKHQGRIDGGQARGGGLRSTRGGATRVPIKVGITDGNMTEVEGLEPGREVIIDVVRDKGKAPAAGGSGHGS